MIDSVGAGIFYHIFDNVVIFSKIRLQLFALNTFEFFFSNAKLDYLISNNLISREFEIPCQPDLGEIHNFG